MRGCPGVGLKKKRKKVRDKGGLSASEARHHCLFDVSFVYDLVVGDIKIEM